MDLEKKIEDYLEDCASRKKLNAKTIKAYKIDLGQFVGFVNADTGRGLDKSTISTYLTSLHSTFESRTVKRKVATIKAFFNYMEYEEIISENPIRKIKTKFKEPKVLPRTIPIASIESILGIAYTEVAYSKTEYSQFANLRDVAVLELMFATGMRVSEICSLKVEDIDLTSGKVLIMGKGSKERVVQIGNADVLSVLRRYYESDPSRIRETGFFFANRSSSRLSEQSVRFMIRRLREKAGVDLHVTPHMFRHSFATLLLEEDVDIRCIQKILGHSSIQTTQIYTQVATEKQRQILMTKHPRNKISPQRKKEAESETSQ